MHVSFLYKETTRPTSLSLICNICSGIHLPRSSTLTKKEINLSRFSYPPEILSCEVYLLKRGVVLKQTTQTALQDQYHIIDHSNFPIFFIPLYFYLLHSSHLPQLSFCYKKLLYESAFLLFLDSSVSWTWICYHTKMGSAI